MATFIQSTALNIVHELFDLYESFKLAKIISCCFTHAEMLKWFQPFEAQNIFIKTSLGVSSEDREISLYTIGGGPTKIMLWSQMHGDEPTATMALGDIFSFFASYPNHPVTKIIHEKLTLLVIPMLNPDGAQRFTRRTAQLIDINRDALSLETPEAKILKETRNKYQPEYGFNLHDQDPRLTVGTTKKITAIALLAPSTDELRIDNQVRLKAKKVASSLAQTLNLFIPGHLAKWDDTFEPRAFGDNIQKWGTSTVLVESGGWRGDPNKFFLRKLNCIGLLAALYSIATEEINNVNTVLYEEIPFNTKLGCDYIIRNAAFRKNENISPIMVDVGVNYDKRVNITSGQLEKYATIVDIGDLSTFTALEEEFDAKGSVLDTERIKLDIPFPIAELRHLIKQT